MLLLLCCPRNPLFISTHKRSLQFWTFQFGLLVNSSPALAATCGGLLPIHWPGSAFFLLTLHHDLGLTSSLLCKSSSMTFVLSYFHFLQPLKDLFNGLILNSFNSYCIIPELFRCFLVKYFIRLSLYLLTPNFFITSFFMFSLKSSTLEKVLFPSWD